MLFILFKLITFRTLFGILLGASVAVGTSLPSDSQAQIQTQTVLENDTIWGEGTFHTEDNEGASLGDQDILCTPYLMQGDTIPDTTWTFTTSATGFVDFSLPVYIDLETSINEQNYNSIDAVAFPNPGSDVTLQFSGKAVGQIHAYDITGKEVVTIKPQYNAARNISGGYLDLSKHADGIYIIKAESEEGIVAKKIIKRGSHKAGNLFGQANNIFAPELRSTKNFIAEYIIEMDRPGFVPFKDTLSFTDGDNGLVDLIMQKVSVNDTIWGYGTFSVINENFTSINNEDIFCTPVQMLGDTIPDTTYIFTTNNVGEINFNLPVFIELAKKNSGKSSNSNQALKSVTDYEASYAIHISHENHYDFDDTITIVQDNNGFITLIMEELPGIPQYQYIGGTFFEEDQTPLQGATVQIYDLGTNQLLGETTSQVDGTYLFENSLSTNVNFYFKAGGIEGKFADVGAEATTPLTITSLSDTLKAVYHFTLYDKERPVPGEPPGTTVTPSAFQVQELHNGSNVEYSLRDSLLFYFTDAWTEPQKEANRNSIDAGEELFGMQGVFTEVNYTLNNINFLEYDAYTNPFIGQVGINIAPGGDNTNPYLVEVTTPLGNTFISTPGAEMTLSGNESSLYKEFFLRVFYGSEVVSRPSWANPISTMPNFLDRGIAKTIYNHYINVFDNQTAYFGLENIAEDMSENKNTSTTYSWPFKEVPLIQPLPSVR